MNEPPVEVLDRVRKLLDKAESTGNDHESEAFAHKAAELIARHRIDPARLAAARSDGDLGVIDIDIGRGAYVRARLALVQAIAGNHDARVVFQSTPTGTIAHVAGFRTDLDAVELLYASLHQQAAAQMAGIRRSTAAATQRFRRSFLFGYAQRIHEVLRSARAEVESAAQTQGRGTRRRSKADGSGAAAGLAVIMAERAERVDEFAAAAFGRVRTARPPRAAQAVGWDAGAAAASRADVGRSRLPGRRAIGRGR